MPWGKSISSNRSNEIRYEYAVVSDLVRLLGLLIVLVTTTLSASTIAFVSPLSGSQTVGVMPLEITTDTPNVNRVEFLVDGALVGVVRQAPYRMLYDFGVSLEPRQITARVLSDDFRRTETASIRTAAVAAGETMDVDLVEVPMRLRAKRSVSPGDFALHENGVAQKIRSVRADRGPAQFVFVVDRSLSMGEGRLEAALGAIDRERHQLRDGDTASVILFNHQVAKPVALGKGDKATALSRDITPSGGTSIRDALASLPRRVRVHAIVITDGSDRSSALAEEEALRRISGTATTIHAIVLGSSSPFLSRATQTTGGRFAHADKNTLRSALSATLADINSRHTVIYQSSGTGKGWRTIKVSPRRGITIMSAKKGYYAS